MNDVKNRIVKQQNVELEITDIDIKRVKAVLDGKLSAKWVSLEEINAIKDKLYDVTAGKLQTHYGVLSIQ
jgi:hypothetical protein